MSLIINSTLCSDLALDQLFPPSSFGNPPRTICPQPISDPPLVNLPSHDLPLYLPKVHLHSELHPFTLSIPSYPDVVASGIS